MRLTFTHERILVLLISAHSLMVGGMLFFTPAWAVRFGGWPEVDELFFVRQAGVFHFVVVAGYLIEHCRYRGVTFLVVTKTIAVVFLAFMAACNGAPWAVLASGVGDGLMALAVLIVHRFKTES